MSKFLTLVILGEILASACGDNLIGADAAPPHLAVPEEAPATRGEQCLVVGDAVCSFRQACHSPVPFARCLIDFLVGCCSGGECDEPYTMFQWERCRDDIAEVSFECTRSLPPESCLHQMK